MQTRSAGRLVHETALRMLGWSLLLVLITQLLVAPPPPAQGAGVSRIASVSASAPAGASRDGDTPIPGLLPIDCLPEGPGWRCARRLRVTLPAPASPTGDDTRLDRAPRMLYAPNFVGALVVTLGGRLEPFFVGDGLRLRRHHEHTRLRVVALPRLFEGALLAMAMGSLAVWMLRRGERVRLSW
jgi:hypothetical protein